MHDVIRAPRRLLSAAILAGTLAAVLGFSSGAALAQAQGTLGVSVDAAPAGSAVRIFGAGCVAGAQVEIRFDGELIQDAEAAADGSFSSMVTIPAGTAPGAHTVSALCGASSTSSITLTARVTVTTGALAGTGTSASRLLLAGYSALAAGVALVAIGQRRGRPTGRRDR